jgi:hypothetical protein
MLGFGLELLFFFSSNYLFTYLFPFLPFSKGRNANLDSCGIFTQDEEPTVQHT